MLKCCEIFEDPYNMTIQTQQQQNIEIPENLLLSPLASDDNNQIINDAQQQQQ